ncbi:MAG: RNA-binding protein [Candidatus Chromulinivorax sp.]|nr:RNA-binding protein [Candidatus Chromulinivorax sp.]
MKMYVGNLSFDTSEGDLRQKFEEFGDVASVNIITDRDTGRSKGFAFVEMTSNASAETAMNSLNGNDFNGRKLTVNEARPRTERPAGNGGFRSNSNSSSNGGGSRRW